MTRAITSGELTKLRSDNQHSALYAYIHHPRTVFSCLVGTIPATTDSITQVNYTNPTGNTTDVLDGMTVLIGTSAGARDVGIVRARFCGNGVLTIGMSSDIIWVTGQFITVLEDWFFSQRTLAFDAGIWNIEGDTTYTDQNTNCDPMPILGPMAAVLRLTGSTVTFSPDASNSWVPGSSISGYSWSAPGSSASSGMTTATPTITYNAAGAYRVDCTVSAANGKTAIGHRWVYIPSDSDNKVQIKLENLTGERDSGGWSFGLTMWDPTEISSIQDRALVVIYADDYYGGVLGSIGPVAGYENVIAEGWIDGNTVDWNPEQGDVKFTAKGPAAWLALVGAWPVSVLDTASTPTDWMHFEGLTVDAGIWFIAHWHSTMSLFMDVYPSGDTRRAYDCSGDLGTLWDQFKALCIKLGGLPLCDRYGRFFTYIDPQLIPVGNRSSIPVVMDITKGDWSDTLTIQAHEYLKTGLLEVAGFYYGNGVWSGLIARAPGNSMSPSGTMQSQYNFIFTDQNQANLTAQLLYAEQNNLYPTIPITLAANNRFIDLAPAQYLTLTIASTDTPSGITWTAKRIIAHRIEIALGDGGMITTTLECEAETVPLTPGIQVVYPTAPVSQTPMDGISSNFPMPSYNFTPPTYVSDTPAAPDTPCRNGTDTTANGPWNTWISGARYSDSPADMITPYKGWCRPSGASNPTRYTINAQFMARDANYNWVDDATDTWYDIYLLDSSYNIVATGIHDPVTGSGHTRTGYFAPPSGCNFDYIKIVMQKDDISMVGNVTSQITVVDHGGGNTGVDQNQVVWSHNSLGIDMVCDFMCHSKWASIEPQIILWPSGSGSLTNLHFHAIMKRLYLFHDQPAPVYPAMPYWQAWQTSHSLDWNGNSILVDQSNPALLYVALKTLDMANLSDFHYQETIANPTPANCTVLGGRGDLRAGPYSTDPIVHTTGEVMWRLSIDPSHMINFATVMLWNICAHS